MYVARRPQIADLARYDAYVRGYENEVAGRGLYGGVWHQVGAAGEPALLNGWAGDAAFLRDTEGFVYLRGQVVGGTGPVFYLPGGHRPPYRLVFEEQSGLNIMGVHPDGAVSAVYQRNSTLVLDGFAFRLV